MLTGFFKKKKIVEGDRVKMTGEESIKAKKSIFKKLLNNYKSFEKEGKQQMERDIKR